MSFISEEDSKPQSGWKAILQVSKFFCIQLHIYKFNTTYGLEAMQEINFRHRRILRTLCEEDIVKPKALNSTISCTLI